MEKLKEEIFNSLSSFNLSPYVTNNHQYKNAMDLVNKEAGLMLEESNLTKKCLEYYKIVQVNKMKMHKICPRCGLPTDKMEFAEELEQEAEEKTAQYMAEHTEKYNCENTKLETDNYNTGREYGFEDGYLAAAEPREEQIEQLKQENVDLEKKNTALRQDWDVMKSTISDYEKEN